MAPQHETEPTAAERGQKADAPSDLPATGWKETLTRVKTEMKKDNVPLLGAGVAFYALVAIVPGLIAFVSIYGLVADPADVERQINDLLAAAPSEVRELVREQLTSVVDSTSTGLGLGAVFGVLAALWSASSGMKHLMAAINNAYDEEESRGFLKLRGTALLLTVGAVLGGAVAFGAIAVLPALLSDTGLGDAARITVSIIRFPLLGLGLLVALAVLYRFAPDRDEPQWVWVAPGSIVAVVGWLIASAAFSFYTANFGSYDETYGSLGAIIVVMLWLMISATVVIIGAELNAEAEHQTAKDTTMGPREPLGQRGAYVADTLPGPAGREGAEGSDGSDGSDRSEGRGSRERTSSSDDESAFTVRLRDGQDAN